MTWTDQRNVDIHVEKPIQPKGYRLDQCYSHPEQMVDGPHLSNPCFASALIMVEGSKKRHYLTTNLYYS